MTLPSKYRFLLDEPGPRILTEGLRLYGTREVAGSGSNPTILQWARELDIPYNADAIPWCGLYMAIVAHRAGWPTTSQPLWARSWATWQTRAERPSLGDILIFSRGPAHGHVGIYVGEGRFIHSPSRGGRVRIDALAAPHWTRSFQGAKRILDAAP